MKTMITALGLGLALSMLIGTSALATAPTAVNCAALKTAITIVDSGLPNDLFKSLGDLVSTSILNGDAAGTGGLTDALNYVYGLLTGGSTPFTTAKQVISTVAGCKLVPHLISEIND